MAEEDKEKEVEGGIYASALKRLPEQSITTVRFFEKNNDYEMYIVFGKDAQLAAKEIFKSNAVIKTYGKGSNKVEGVNLNRTNFESWVRDLLLIKQYRVEVYTNNSGAKGRIEWVAQYKGSPGNLIQFEDLLFSNSEVTVNNGVIGVRVGYVEKNKNVGVAFVNTNECRINLLEFLDDDSLSNFETVVVQLAPKEAVVAFTPSQNADVEAVKKILERNGVLVSEKKAAEFDTKDMDQDLVKLLKVRKGDQQIVTANKELEKTVACSALCGVIKYLELLSGDTYLKQFRLEPFEMALYAKMDVAACRALHLNQNSLEQHSRNETTLMTVIDKCRTAQGKRLLCQYLKQPLLDKNKLEERLDIVDALVEDVVLRQSLFEGHLRRVPDCQLLSRKMLKKRSTLQDCYRGYLCILKLPNLVKDLEAHEGPKSQVIQSNFIQPLKAMQDDFNKYAELIQTTLDLERAETGEFVVRPDIDEVIQEIRNKMDELENRMSDQTYEVARDLKLEANKSLKLEQNTQHGHYFRITMKEQKGIRDNKSFTILASARGGVSFRNSTLEHLSNKYIAERKNYEEEQKKYVEEILEIAVGYASLFEQLGNLMSVLDVMTNFAYISANSPSPFVRPILHEKGTGILKLEGVRHPCVEIQPNISFIPNDIHFNKDEKNFYIVTGPNMGGKSTFLRSVGIATLLAQVGCYVPANYAEISIVDGILARVGASDNLTKGVSTFMAEMIETSFILKTATQDTLVLIDELGRGTSTYDGFGLCWAISERLAKRIGCFCILATHFHELTALSDEAENVANVHFTAVADEDGLTMMYKLEKGACDRSFGIHVTQVTNFPPDVIENAKAMAKKLEDFAQDEDMDDDEAAVKRRAANKLAGIAEVGKFKESLKEAADKCNASVKLGELRMEDAEKKFQLAAENLLQEIEVKAEANPYLKHLLEQSKME